MQLATPRSLAQLLRRDKEVLLAAWETKVRALPGTAALPTALLRNHLPHLLAELAKELERPETYKQRLRAFSEAHGAQRQQTDVDVLQVLGEYNALRLCVLQHAEHAGLALTSDANRIVNELIDEGSMAAVRTYIEHRDVAEKRRRDEYLQFVVHDLRSPLSAIYYALLLAERELRDSDAGERVLNIHAAIKRNIERMRALIVKLLQEDANVHTASRIEVRHEAVELWPTVESALRTLAPLAASLETEMLNQVPRDLIVRGDGGLLERVFQNLISNAIEHTPKGSVRVGAASTGDGVECWVIDNGRGVAEHVRKAAFEKFTTDTTRGDGVGLGLAIAKRFVEAHGGTIHLQSEPDRGTTVRFTIPRR